MYKFYDTGQRRRFPDFGKSVEEFEVISFTDNSNKIIIVRPILYFYVDQKDITLGKLREFFTNKGIAGLETDGYIKIEKK